MRLTKRPTPFAGRFAADHWDNPPACCASGTVVALPQGTPALAGGAMEWYAPDGVKNQIEGNMLQSLSRALKEEVRFDERRITSADWGTYPILTFSEVPEMEIVLLDRADQPALGAGEPSTVTTAPAVANAVFDATGAQGYACARCRLPRSGYGQR